jgi:signal transduction histidine kinase
MEALVGERVRRELARELHDRVVQELTATLVDLENFRRLPFDRREAAARIEAVQETLRRTLCELRQMLHGLRDEEGWQPAFVDALREFGRAYEGRTGVRVGVVADEAWPGRLRAAPAQHLFRIIREAAINARLHGGASAITVSLQALDRDRALISVQDDGAGLDPDLPPGHGLLGMRERVALLGGSLAIEGGPDGGTIVRVELPIAALA